MSKSDPADRKPHRQSCPEESTFLELSRTADLLSRPIASLLKSQELSLTQYNVLRILRGTPEGLPCGEIANRMITRDPDITRLLDRLEKRTLIARFRDSKDRRLVMASISPEGLKLLSTLDAPVRQRHQDQLGHLKKKHLNALIELLQLARKPAPDHG
ncbi:MAG TPA: MarR family transcriptional regulator [Acidobacteriaceae bacterium]|nr:MarR family transcriptional regulator [Acidobacteriaceae bacterium]